LEIGSDLPALDAPRNGLTDDLAPGEHHSLAEEPDQPWIVRLLHQQRPGERHVEVAPRVVELRHEVRARVPAIR